MVARVARMPAVHRRRQAALLRSMVATHAAADLATFLGRRPLTVGH